MAAAPAAALALLVTLLILLSASPSALARAAPAGAASSCGRQTGCGLLLRKSIVGGKDAGAALAAITQTHAVRLAPSRSATAPPGVTVTYTHMLTNAGDGPDSFILSAASTAGWYVSHAPQRIMLDPGMTATVAISVAVPTSARAGARDRTTLTATSALEPASTAAVTDTTIAARVAGVALAPDRAGTAAPGEAVAYTHTLTNSGNLSDTFSLSAASARGWLQGLTPLSVTLAPGVRTTIRVTSSVAAGTLAGTEDVATITATSGADPSVSAVVTDVTTTAFAAGAQLVPARSGEAQPGKTLLYTHTLTNSGNGSDRYLLSGASTRGWLQDVTPQVVRLSAGASASIQVLVTIPLTAAIGIEDVATIRATSHIDPEVSATVQATTTVGASTGVLLTPLNMGRAEPGETAVYTHTLRNMGGEQHTFLLSAASSAAWALRLSTLSVTLQADAEATVSVSVTVPLSAVRGDQDLTTVTATAQQDAAITDSALNLTTVTPRAFIYLPLVSEPPLIPGVRLFPDLEGRSLRDGSRTYLHILVNTGTHPDTFAVSAASSQGWTTTLSASAIRLEPRERAPVRLTVQPGGAPVGSTETTTVTVRSGHNGAVSDLIVDKTTTCMESDIDLIISDIWTLPATPAAGESATIFVTVRNQGSDDVPADNNFYVDLYVDQQPAYRLPGSFSWGVQAAWVEAGDGYTFSAPWIFSAGAHTLWAQADTDDTVPADALLCEASETNNVGDPLAVMVSGPQRQAPAPPAPVTANSAPRSTPVAPAAAGETGESGP